MDSEIYIVLGSLDWAVIAIYGTFMFGIAIWAYPKVKDCGSYLVGSRKMGKLMIGAASFAGGTNANDPMAVSSACFKQGFSGMWLSLSWMLITPFFWLFPPVVRRLRVVTNVDIVHMRFGPVMALLYKLVAVVTTPIALALGIKSAAILVQVVTGGVVSEEWALAIVCVPTLIYTLLGGVIAAYATDVLQGFLVIFLSVILIPFALLQFESFEALDNAIADELTVFLDFSSVEFGFWWIFWFTCAITLSAVISTSAGASAAKDEMVARMKVYGLILKRFCTLGWGLIGVLAVGLYASHPLLDPGSGVPGTGPDNVFALASGDLLPVVLKGLMVASILASVMSTLDAVLLSLSGIVVNNLYREYLVKAASPKHYLLAARLATTAALIAGWWVATGVDDLVEFVTIVSPITALTGTSILVAVMWRRVTAAGAIASVCIASPLFLAVNNLEFSLLGQSLFTLLHLQPVAELLAGWYSINLFDAVHGFIDSEGTLTRLPVQIKFPIFIIPSLASIILVSLLSKQHNSRSVDEFYARLEAPVGEEDNIREKGFEVDHLKVLDSHDPDVNVKPKRTERLLLVDFFYLPKLLYRRKVRIVDYKNDLIGTIGFSIFVVAFLMSVQMLGKLF